MQKAVVRLALGLGVLSLVTGTAAAQQHARMLTDMSSIHAQARPIVSPQATISGAASGIYCPDMADKAVGVHDLGWLPSGRDVTVVVSATGGLAAFDPVANLHHAAGRHLYAARRRQLRIGRRLLSLPVDGALICPSEFALLA
jgi:hypothetical protein